MVIKVYVRCEGCVGYKCYVCRVLTSVGFYVSKQPIQVRKELEVKLAAERMEELRAKKEYDKRVTAAWEEGVATRAHHVCPCSCIHPHPILPVPEPDPTLRCSPRLTSSSDFVVCSLLPFQPHLLSCSIDTAARPRRARCLSNEPTRAPQRVA